MLLLAQDEEQNGARMTDTQVRDEAMTLFLAGHETTANALTWTWHLLAQHPDVERRLHEELDTVIGDRLPRADDAASLPYTRRVLAEVDALLSAGVGHRPARDRGRRDRRLHDSARHRRPPVAVPAAPRRAVLS